MFYVVTESEIVKGISLNEINKKLNAKFDPQDFKKVGKDHIVSVDQSDLVFVQDKKIMSRIPIQKLYKKGNENLILYGILALQIIILLKG